ncbi:MAG: histidine phosphatase family protein [Actinomycetota bacterium]|nr:histidine phosphatase family protein [Actinomycetota bacterium]MDQ3720710.1 histidine phosphatase family protein [Actinomycetota bacterium]
MKTAYVVRHGRTDFSSRGIYSGRAEVPLTQVGREQAAHAAQSLRLAGVDAVYTSPLGRARVTAEAIAAATGTALRVDERLTEVDYGPIEGLDRSAAEERWGEAFRSWRERPFEAHLPGMEPLADALARARAVTADALAGADRPALVGHQGILRLVLMALGHIERDDYFTTRLPEADPLPVAVGEAGAL